MCLHYSLRHICVHKVLIRQSHLVLFVLEVLFRIEHREIHSHTLYSCQYLGLAADSAMYPKSITLKNTKCFKQTRAKCILKGTKTISTKYAYPRIEKKNKQTNNLNPLLQIVVTKQHS